MLRRAQMYIEAMSQGINPVTGEVVCDNDTLNNIKVSRCLFFVNDILKELICNNGKLHREKVPRVQKQNFVYNEHLMQQVTVCNTPISLSEIIRNILKIYGDETKLTYKMVAELLLNKGIYIKNAENSPKYIATPESKKYGIYTELRHTMQGDRLITLYNSEGQKYLLSLLKDLK